MNSTEQDETPRPLAKVVSARAFISPRDDRGGNPVTIFHLSTPTTSDERSKLAQSCHWESIIIDDNGSVDSEAGEILPKSHFYMPSGEEVSFCGREFSNLYRMLCSADAYSCQFISHGMTILILRE